MLPRNKMKVLTAAALIMMSAMPAHALLLETPLDQNNGQRGIMFDVKTGATAITFKSLGVDIYDGTTATYEFYTIEGGITGKINDSTGWTLRDSFNSVTGLASGVLNTFDITDFAVSANSLIGFYFTNTSSGGVSYTNSPTVGEVRASDSNLTIYSGVGKSYSFGNGDTFTARSFNGSISYSTASAENAVPEPGTLALLGLAFFGLVAARRRKQ